MSSDVAEKSEKIEGNVENQVVLMNVPYTIIKYYF